MKPSAYNGQTLKHASVCDTEKPNSAVALMAKRQLDEIRGVRTF